MFKIFIKAFLIIACTMFSLSIAFAEDLVPIGALDGIKYYIDFEDIGIQKQYISYSISYIAGDYTKYIVESNCENNTIRNIRNAKYSGGEYIDSKWLHTKFFTPKPKTVNYIGHTAACKIIKNNPFLPVDTMVWHKYIHGNVYLNFLKNWNPKYRYNFSKPLISTIELIIDKSGNILSYKFISSESDDKFNNSIKKAVEKVKFPSLPDGYDKNIRIYVDFKYVNNKYGHQYEHSNLMNYKTGDIRILVQKNKKYLKEELGDAARTIITFPAFMFVMLFAN